MPEPTPTNPPQRWRTVLVLVTGGILALCIAAAASVSLVLLASDAFLYEEWWIGKLMGTTFTATIYAALILGAAVILHRGRFASAMALAMALLFGAAGLWTWLIWGRFMHPQTEDHLVMAALSFTFPGVAIVHNGAMACLVARGTIHRVARFAVCAGVSVPAVVLAIMLWWTVFFDAPDIFEVIGPVMMIVGFVSLLSSSFVIMFIRHASRQWEAARESVSQRITLDLECPRCHARQGLAAGLARCGSCGLAMRIELEEPRCDCGYLLYKLQSPTCPECGRAIPESSRWSPVGAASP